MLLLLIWYFIIGVIGLRLMGIGISGLIKDHKRLLLVLLLFLL